MKNLKIQIIFQHNKFLIHSYLLDPHRASNFNCTAFRPPYTFISGIALTRKGYNEMPLHVMEQLPRFFALAYRVSILCIVGFSYPENL
jgi:hypothetical protein